MGDSQSTAEYDVVIVGGGPAGCAAGIFTARYGLETLVCDRGRSSLRQCAFLENYPGFPGGIDIERFYGLLHAHATRAGCEVVPDLVTGVSETAGGERLRVERQEGADVTAGRVVAATRYDAEYLRPLAGADAFETVEYDGETAEQFDRSYPDRDGTTPVERLYVASPSRAADRQAIVAAGRGARVGLTLVEDVRRERGFPDPVADHRDWQRRAADRSPEWDDRDRWREWFERRLPEAVDGDRMAALREAEIDRHFETYLTEEEIGRRTEQAQRRLLDHVDDSLVLERAREIADES